MIKSVKIRLKPTHEQEILMRKSIGIQRFTYNWGLQRWNELYEHGEKPTKIKIRTQFNQYKKQLPWIGEVSQKVTAQAFEDLNQAFQNFFSGQSKKPKFKSKRQSKPSFYVRYDGLRIKEDTIHLEKIGYVKFKTNYKIPSLEKYVNPRCSFDGKYWYLSFGYEHNENQVELNDISVGLDLGIKTLVSSNIDELDAKNINKSLKVRNLKKKINRLQRQVSRKYEMNKIEKNKIDPNVKSICQFKKTNNIIKLECRLKKLHRQLYNIRQNHLHQITNRVVKIRPQRVVVENLNVKGMMKNKHLAKAIQEQNFYEFSRQMEYKCQFNGIEFVKADRFYPSSKKCSSCGTIKHNLKLKDRIYVCDHCGLVINRDKNAGINLAKYQLV